MEPVVKTVSGNSNALSDVQDPKRRVGIDELIGCRPTEIEDVADVFDGVRGGACGVHVVRSFVFCVTQFICVQCSITEGGRVIFTKDRSQNEIVKIGSLF